MTEPNRIMVRETSRRDYVIRICRDITEIDDFDDEFQVLAAATPDDTITFILDTNGGHLATGLLLAKAIRATEAHTIAHIGFTCASAGTTIALACDEWQIDEYSSFMVHTASYGTGHDIAPNTIASAMHMDKMVKRFVENTYTGFLTEEEMLIVQNGRDVYFEGEDLATRLTNYAEYRMEQAQKFLEEELEEELDELPIAE